MSRSGKGPDGILQRIGDRARLIGDGSASRGVSLSPRISSCKRLLPYGMSSRVAAFMLPVFHDLTDCSKKAPWRRYDLRDAGMGSVSSTNPGIAALFQTLSTVSSPLMSSQGTVSALESASPSDIVALSDAATQLQGVSELFGLPDASNASGSESSLSYLLALAADPAQTTSSAASSTAPAAGSSATDQLANYQATLQEQQTQGLLGAGLLA